MLTHITDLNQRVVNAILVADLSKYIDHAHNHLIETGKVPVLSKARAEVALKQFYAGSALRQGLACAVSRNLDDYWHSHVLHTRDYRDFCEKVVGGFINHNPLDKTDVQETERLVGLYVDTRISLLDYFGKDLIEEAFPVLTSSNMTDIIVCDWDPPRAQ